MEVIETYYLNEVYYGSRTHSTMTPHVSNHQVELKAIRIPMGKIEKFKFCHHAPDDPIQEFWKFYQNKLGVSPTRECHPNILLYDHANLKEKFEVRKQ
jgi:hypothetical protein